MPRRGREPAVAMSPRYPGISHRAIALRVSRGHPKMIKRFMQDIERDSGIEAEIVAPSTVTFKEPDARLVIPASDALRLGRDQAPSPARVCRAQHPQVVDAPDSTYKVRCSAVD